MTRSGRELATAVPAIRITHLFADFCVFRIVRFQITQAEAQNRRFGNFCNPHLWERA